MTKLHPLKNLKFVAKFEHKSKGGEHTHNPLFMIINKTVMANHPKMPMPEIWVLYDPVGKGISNQGHFHNVMWGAQV